MVIAMTDYERRIYELVNASHSHMTAEEVHKQLKSECPSVSLATVYNNLNRLWQEERICKISVEGMPDRYDRIRRHDHVVCKGCGRLLDVDLGDLTAQLERAAGRPILAYDLKLIDLCQACREKEKER